MGRLILFVILYSHNVISMFRNWKYGLVEEPSLKKACETLQLKGTNMQHSGHMGQQISN